MKPDRSAHYWNSISQTFVLDKQQSLWRSHSDQINISLLGEWVDGRQFDALLKTDLFDEAVSQGLYPLLRGHAVAVYGIDVAQESAEKAKMRFAGLKVICADIRNLPCKDHRFDLVVSNSTLDHFHSTDEIDAGLRELFRVLRPGGELHISLDNLQNPVIGLRSLLPYRLLKGLRLVPYFVGKTHGRRGLTKALKRSGFEILESTMREGDIILFKGRNSHWLQRVILSLMGKNVKCKLQPCDFLIRCSNCPCLEKHTP
jgi:SAM-dependent methyltransferase